MPDFGPVQITTRPHAVMARVLRMTNMSIASSAGLHVDKVQDVALATNEAFSVALTRPGIERVTCGVEVDDGAIHIRIAPSQPPSPALPSPEVDPLAHRVLSSITTSYTHDRSTGDVAFTISNS